MIELHGGGKREAAHLLVDQEGWDAIREVASAADSSGRLVILGVDALGVDVFIDECSCKPDEVKELS